MKARNSGMTILEVLLVLMIGASIIMLSLRQYASYRRDADAVRVLANVNAIFQAMSAYYRTNCYGTVDSNQKLIPGTLNPAKYYPSTTPINKTLDIQTELIDTGFLPLTKFPLNPLVNSAGAGMNGYVAQFNRVEPPTDRTICSSNTTPCPPANIIPVGKVIVWRAQVAVELKNPATARQFFNILAGDCRSTSGTTECKDSTNTGNFVIWERVPTSSNTKTLSSYWVTMPTVTQFTQMYTTNPMSSLTNGSATDTQYYVCGN